jgi:hypothetical protein
LKNNLEKHLFLRKCSTSKPAYHNNHNFKQHSQLAQFKYLKENARTGKIQVQGNFRKHARTFLCPVLASWCQILNSS